MKSLKIKNISFQSRNVKWVLTLITISILLIFMLVFYKNRQDVYLIHSTTKDSLMYDVEFSQDGNIYAISDSIGNIEIRNTVNSEVINELVGHEGSVFSFSFSENNQNLVSTGVDGTIRLWDINDNRLIYALNLGRNTIDVIEKFGRKQTSDEVFYSTTFSPNGNIIAAGGKNGKIILIDSSTGQVVHSLQGHFFNGYYRDIISIAFSPDGRFLASAGTGDSVHIWRVQDGKLIQQIKTPTTNADILGIAFTQNGTTISFGRRTGEVETWSIDGRFLTSVNTQMKEIRSIAFDHNGREFAVGGGTTPDEYEDIPFLEKRKDTRILIWRLGALEPRLILTGHTDNVESVAFSPDEEILVSVSSDNTIRLWHVR
jgi:WD40 repeat protein